MGIFDRFPYSSTHEMNLDFMLGKAQEINEQLHEVTSGLDEMHTGLAQISEQTERATAAATAAEAAKDESQQNERDAFAWTEQAEQHADRAEAALSQLSDEVDRAEAAATRAETAAQNASISATGASNAADLASQNAATAAQQAANARQSATTAEGASGSATAAAHTATTNANAAADAAALASGYNTQAATSATNAATSATNAAASAQSILGVEQNIENLVEGLPEDFTALVSDINKLKNDVNTAEKRITKQSYNNLLYGLIAPQNETYRNVSYEWQDGTCHVFNPESGGATNTSYHDVFADPNTFPDGIMAGKTYLVTGASNNVQIRIYQAVNGAYVSTPTILTAESNNYVTIPDNASGLRMRLYVMSGRVVDEYITPEMLVINQPEKLVFTHKIAMFGDSIISGRDGDAEAGTHTPYEIPNTISKRIGCVVDNLGVSNMGWVAQGSGMNAYDKISSTDLTQYDVITLCFGVNDGFQPIGNYDSTNETEVMGQFNKVINYIYTQKPAIQVIVIAPFNGCNVGSFPKYWYGTVPSNAYSCGVLSDTLKQACEYYNIPYIEQKNGPLNGFTVKKDILDGNGKSLTYMGADGVHPSNAGYKAIGGWLSGEISRLIG